MTQNKNKFIKLNHGLVDINSIVGISDIFWLETEIKPKKTTKNQRLGLRPKKIRKLWSFTVYLYSRLAITISPTVRAGCVSSNTLHYTQTKHEEIKKILCEKE